jgi:uncharacterized protein YbbC (DUF1343 family)
VNRRTLLASLGALGVAGLAARPAQSNAAQFMLGGDVFAQDAWRQLEGRSVGIVTNQSGVTSSGESIVDVALRNPAISVKALYAPEHGLRGDRPAGAYVPSYTDPRTGLPVYSLYGATRHPTAEMLAGVDVLLFDIQDVGSRAYTYISTMAYAMQGAAEHGKTFWVLDRPNPVGGVNVEGPVLDPRFASFIGLYPIAMRHGMTIGELARMFNDAFGIGASLHVVPMRGWTRATIWPQTGLPWIRTSPNMPTWQTTFVYLCTGLIANAGVNNGVGTSAPFFYAGAFGLDGDAYAASLVKRRQAGVAFPSASWSPSSGFWKDRTLEGVRLDVTDPSAFLPVSASVELLVALREIAPHALRIEPALLDRDWGTDSLRLSLQQGLDADAIVGSWQSDLARFKARRQRYLLYV